GIMLPFKGLILLKSFTFYHRNSLLTSVDCYTLLKSKFFATVPIRVLRPLNSTNKPMPYNGRFGEKVIVNSDY
ncbi:hypothetical protein ACR9PT_09280, partial [Piscirickettsia salmonis]|uniref:hypothetical protein n=1 Tax=Piscirickettsia salmonis TaxID=1238 RepID=UPI003EC032A7